MSQPLTTDNADDIIRKVVREDFAEVHNRLKVLEKLVRDDLALDRGQKDDLPDSESRLDSIYSKGEEIKTEIRLLKDELKLIKEQLQALIEKVDEMEF